MAMSITTSPATLVTETTARLNGIATDVFDNAVGFDYGIGAFTDRVFVVYPYTYGDYPYYLDLTSLEPDTQYQFRAWYYANGYYFGITRYFTTEAIGTEYEKPAAGTLSLSGNVDTIKYHTPVRYYRAPGGTLTLVGATEVTDVDYTAEVAVGGHTLSLDGDVSKDAFTPEQFEKAVGGHTLSLSGAAEFEVEEAPEPAIAGGSLSFTKKLTMVVYKAAPSGGLPMAGVYDLVGANAIEQGATFSRTCKWKSSSGSVVDLTDYSLRGYIRAYPESSSALASFVIAVSSPASSGIFVISLPATTTAALDFTRGFYDIEAVSGATVKRLMQGRVALSREATA